MQPEDDGFLTVSQKTDAASKLQGFMTPPGGVGQSFLLEFGLALPCLQQGKSLRFSPTLNSPVTLPIQLVFGIYWDMPLSAWSTVRVGCSPMGQIGTKCAFARRWKRG